MARNYPDEIHDGHIRPDLQTWDSNPMNAGYTQVVQKRGGAARSEIIDVASLDAKFDEIYQRGGIYNFMSHPQWLDYGADGFYERHLAHISRRRDIWYVPMGPLYAYRVIYERTEVRPLAPGSAKARFELSNRLDPKIYSGSVTLEFAAPSGIVILGIDQNCGGWGNIRGFPRWNVDATVAKDFRWGERLRVTASLQFTNVFNHFQPSDPSLSLASPTAFGVVSGQVYTPRQTEFGLRIAF